MYDLIQNALTYASEAIAFIAIIGLPTHSIITSHINKVKPCATPQATPQPEPEETLEELFQEADQIISKEIYAEAEPEVAESIPTAKAVEKPVKTRKTCKTTNPQPMLVGSAAVNYDAMTSELLRKECSLAGIAWRNAGNGGKHLKKGEMISALQ